MPAKSGIDRHDQDLIDDVDHRLDRFDGRARVERYAHPLAKRADRLHGSVEVRARLHMDDNGIGSRSRECLEVRIAWCDHEMNIERFPGVGADGLHHVGPE